MLCAGITAVHWNPDYHVTEKGLSVTETSLNPLTVTRVNEIPDLIVGQHYVSVDQPDACSE